MVNGMWESASLHVDFVFNASLRPMGTEESDKAKLSISAMLPNLAFFFYRKTRTDLGTQSQGTWPTFAHMASEF